MNNKNECRSCSKENVNIVPIGRVIELLDGHFAKNDLVAAEELLCYWRESAVALGDNSGLLSILNEQVGLYRRLDKSDNGLDAVYTALKLIEDKFSENRSIATVYINCATTLKNFGKPDEAMPIYLKAEKLLNAADIFTVSTLYNNMAAGEIDLGDNISAEKHYLRAIELLDNRYPNEIAVSYVNLAMLYYRIDELDSRIYDCLDSAWEYINNENIIPNANHAFCAAKCAESFGFFGQFLRKKELSERSEKIYAGN